MHPRHPAPMQLLGSRRPCAQRLSLRILLVALLSLTYTGLIVHYSMRHGRLIVFLTYDDVSYISDGLWRLQTFYNAGPATALHMYVQKPPHAPYSAFVAFLSFAILGVHDWAPYAANVLIVLGYFGFADYLLKGLPLWQKLMVFAFLASFPLLSWAVQEFRPDHVSALLLTMGLIMILKQPWVNSSRKHQAMAGVWCGLAILCKPHTFIGAGLLIGSALVIAALVDQFGNRFMATLKQTAKSWATCLIPAILVPLPHFLVGWNEIYSYIHNNVFGANKDIWQVKGTVAFHLLFYLTGKGGHAAFGGTLNPSPVWPPSGIPSHLVLIIIILAAAILHIAWRQRRSEIVRAGGLALLLLGAFLIPAILRTKSYFFGLEFQTPLVFVTVLALGNLLRSERLSRIRIPIATIGAACITLVGVAAWGFPPANGDFGANWVRNRNEIASSLYRDIRDNPDYADPIVYVPCAGEINDDLLKYWAGRDGRIINAYGPQTAPEKPETSYEQFRNAHFVVIADQGSTLIADFLPQFKIQDQLVAYLKSQPDYALVGRYVYRQTGLGYYLFEHVGDFFGWRPVSGFSYLEGPFPNNELPMVRWGYGPSSTIEMRDTTGGAFVLSLAGRNSFPGQLVTIKLDGKEIGKWPMQASGEFQPTELHFETGPGYHAIEFDYTQWEQVMPRPMGVLFSRMVIRKTPR